MFKRRSFAQPVDYMRRGRDRRKLTTYLRTGSFKRISGSHSVGSEAYLRRLGLYVGTGIVFLIGFCYAIF